MSKSLKIFLSILALISVGFSVSIIFDWNFSNFSNLIKKKNEEETLVTKQATDSPIQSGKNITDLIPKRFEEMAEEDKISLILPVEKKYLETAEEDKNDPQILSFYLDEGTSIKSMFSGRAMRVTSYNNPFAGDKPIGEIAIIKNNSQVFAVYLIVGEILIKENDIIEQGKEIARAKEGFQGFSSGSNLNLAVYDGENRFINMKEFFQKE